MKIRRWTGIFGIAALLFPLASIVILAATGTHVTLLAQYQVDILFPAFSPPEGIMVYNGLWLFMLGNLVLVAFATGLERRPWALDWFAGCRRCLLVLHGGTQCLA